MAEVATAGEPGPPGRVASGRATLAFVVTALSSGYVLFAPDPAGNGAGPPGADELAHLGLFALLAATTRLSFGAARTLLAALASYAALSELVQALVLPRRSGDVRDLLADLLGVTLGWWYAGRGRRARGAQTSPGEARHCSP